MDKIAGLQDYVSSHPEIDKVWFDEKGQWSFAPCTLYPIEKTIDEVMQMGKSSKKTESKEETKTETVKK